MNGVGIAVMLIIVTAFIAYMSFGALIDAGKRETMLENKQIAYQIEQRYGRTVRISGRLERDVQKQLAVAPPEGSADAIRNMLADEMSESAGIRSVAVVLESPSGAEAVNVYADNEEKAGAVQGAMQSDWYKTVKDTGKPLLADPEQTQNGKLVARYVAPVEVNGQIVGVVCANISLAGIQKYTEGISKTENYYGVFTRKGTTIAHGLNADFILKRFYDSFPMTEAEIADAFDENSVTAIDHESPQTGEDSVYCFYPMHLEGVDAEWMVFSATERAVFTAAAKKMVLYAVVIAVVCCVLLLVFMSFFVHKRVAVPLGGITGVIEKFAHLDVRADESQAALRERGDEIGTMARSIAELRNNLRGIIDKISNSSQSVAATSEELTATAQSTANSARDVASAIHNIADGATSQAQDTQNASEHIDKIMELMDENKEILRQINESTDNIRREYEILLNEVAQFNEGLLDKHRILAVTKADLLDEELMELLKADLPDDLPVIFISAVTGFNITQLKDILWEELNSESNKLQSVAEGGSIVHRDREVTHLDRDFSDWEDDVVEVDDDDIEEFEDYEIEDVEE